MSRGFRLLALAGVAAVGAITAVHQMQTRERERMRQAVLRDIEKLGR